MVIMMVINFAALKRGRIYTTKGTKIKKDFNKSDIVIL